MNDGDRDPRINLIRQEMELVRTEELIAIWKRHDTKEWTNDALEIVRAILLERMGTLPEQGEEPMPVEAKILETEDTYHDPQVIARIAFWARRLSWVTLIAVPPMIFWLNLESFSRTGSMPWDNFKLTGDIIMRVAVNVINGAGSFIFLQAVAEGLYVLLDIEDSTRRAARAAEKRE